LLVLLDQLL
jgi:hypothetical protein